MRSKLTLMIGLTAAALLLVVAIFWLGDETTQVTEGDITGVVTGLSGPEAGVWVIAETDDLETHFIKIVVTNDEGRFLLPELPDAAYQVWVRGYGLADSIPVEAQRGCRPQVDRHYAHHTHGGRRRLPGELLVFAGRGAAGERIPWYRRRR